MSPRRAGHDKQATDQLEHQENIKALLARTRLIVEVAETKASNIERYSLKASLLDDLREIHQLAVEVQNRIHPPQ